jgi:hypothetical protein
MKKQNWKLLAVVLLIATIIDLFVPDPLPFVDEIILIASSIISFDKSGSFK